MVKIGVRVSLSPAMGRMLVDCVVRASHDVVGPCGTVVALIERGLATAGVENPLTWSGRRLAGLIAADDALCLWAENGTVNRTFRILEDPK